MLGKRPEGLRESVYVHPLALVETSEIGDGTRVWGFTHVMKGARVGARCNLCEGVYVEGGAVVGDGVTVKNGISIWDKVEIENDVFLGPHMVFTNDLRPRAFIRRGPKELLPVRVKKGATIGAGAVIVCGVTIGAYSFVAAGAVVTRDVPDHGLMKGNPARLSGYVCRCAATVFAAERGRRGPDACKDCGTRRPDIVPK